MVKFENNSNYINTLSTKWLKKMNLYYFVIVIPIVVITSLILLKVQDKLNSLLKIIILSILLFFVRIMLVFFSDTIGIMPYIYPDLLFYSLLTIFGIFFTIFYLLKVEKLSFKSIGYKKENWKKSVLFGFLSFFPLICFFPLIIFLTGLEISIIITWEKVILGIAFGIFLGGFYEEVMFRGIIQNHFNSITNTNPTKTILFTSIVFVATHIGYLPFVGYGIFYLFIFIMAVLLSILRYKFNQLACFILHGGIVFILIIFV